jgi:hypothetical protein
MGDISDTHMTEAELASYLHKTTRTLKRYRAARSGPPFTHVGATIFYPKAGVAKWLERGERGGPSSTRRAA